jgi:serine protease AprX
VTAVGNDGPSAVTSPATAVGGLSVGALDDHGTASMSDDSPAPFSGTGDDRRGTPQPDIAAAGVDIVGRLPADSVIARSYPTAEVEPGLFRGSGTSMSTALVAGVAALASSARPDLDGHALQAALRSAGRRVDAPAAVAAAMAAAEHPGHGNGNGPGGGNGPGNGHGNGPGGGNGNGPGGTPPVEPNAVQWRAVQWRAVQWRAVQWRGDHWGDSDWSLASRGAVQWRGYWSGQALVDLQHRAVHWRAVRWAMRPTR